MHDGQKTVSNAPAAWHADEDDSIEGATEMPVKLPCVYMLAAKPNGTLYIGVTSNLVQRVWQHKEGLAESFSKEYGVKALVWYELHDSMESAILREKALKKWERAWKVRLIREANPDWLDLYPGLLSGSTGFPPSRE